MANVRKRGNTYKIEVYKGRDASGKKLVESTTFVPDPDRTDRQNEKALAAFVLEFEKKVKDGSSRGDVLTFEQFAREWFTNYVTVELKPDTVDGYRRILEGWLYPRCGYMKLSEFTPLKIQGVINDMQKKGYQRKGKRYDYSEASLKDARRLLCTVLNAAYQDGLITSNPAARMRTRSHKRVAEEKIRYWTAEQAQFFLERIQAPLPVIVSSKVHKRNGKEVPVSGYIMRTDHLSIKFICFFFVALYSGCRRGEIVGLTWDSVDFDKNSITIKQSAHYTKETGSFIDTPKTQSSYRTITLPPVVMTKLRQLKCEQAREIMFLGSAWTGDRTQKTGFVFTRETGEVMHVQTPGNRFRDLIEQINKTIDDPDKRLPKIRLHDLRHTSASLLIAAGLDPVTVAHRLGHSDPATTLRVYSHAFKEADVAAAEAIEAALSRRVV